VVVVALAAVGEADEGAMRQVEAALARALGVAVRRLPPLPEPDYAHDDARQQYSSTLIMRQALARLPGGVDKLLLVTEHDLFIPMLSFVYGQAQLDGPVALLSLARLRQEFHGLPPNRQLFLRRACTEALHEVGHAFGRVHCDEAGCVMALSTNHQQLDLKGGEYCASCAVLLHDAVAAAGAAAQESRTGGKT